MTDIPPSALLLFSRIGIVRTNELERKGLSRTQLRRLVAGGRIEQLARGMYQLPHGARTEHQQLAEVARRVPGGVVCLLSALRFHELTTQNPFEVWLAVDQHAWRPRSQNPPLRLVYLSPMALTSGVESHRLSNVPVRVFGAARTVVDVFKFRHKIGIDVAIEALRDYRRLHPKRMEPIWRFAAEFRMLNVMRPYLESLE